MAKVFAYDLPQAAKGLLKIDRKTVPKVSITNANRIVKNRKEPLSFMAQLSFAEETLPLGDSKIEGKMKKALRTYNHNTTQTNGLQRKAAEWFPVIEPILARYGIPNDFKYMPLVESGLKSGVSTKGAAGFWQFMPGTARTYGLRVNDGVDERNNLQKSTIAACKYLKELHGIFKSWTLVAAAFNAGDNHIKRQINKQNQDNYFKMKLNKETGKYVYKLISMKQIVLDPQRYGYSAPKELLAYNGK
jgi:membrane-bound lytic murein transglycosylase D